MNVETLTTDKRALVVDLNRSTITNRQLTKELKQAKDQVASLSSQIVELKNTNEEFQRKEAINKENHQSK